MLTLREANQLLGGAPPHIGLMFHSQKSYDFKQLPGFMHVPYNFDAHELLDYVKNNVQECRQLARDHCEKVRLQEKVQKAVSDHKTTNQF